MRHRTVPIRIAVGRDSPVNATPLLPEPFQAIVSEFQAADKDEKLQLLMSFATHLHALPERYQGQHNPASQVRECMTPVYVYAELQASHLAFFFDVPPESSTISGYAAILAVLLENLTPTQVLQIPPDCYELLGLREILSPQRVRGIIGIFSRVRKLAQLAAQMQDQPN